MYILFGKSTRERSFYISNRYSKDSNKYLKSYDPNQESKHIVYLDAFNLYGCAMHKFLLTSEFKWMDSKEFGLNKHTSNSSKGCVLEVDFEYPKGFQELHNDYPVAPDEIKIKREILSDYQLNFANLYNIPIANVTKLVPNLQNQCLT